jgi:hypothetical protein
LVCAGGIADSVIRWVNSVTDQADQIDQIIAFANSKGYTGGDNELRRLIAQAHKGYEPVPVELTNDDYMKLRQLIARFKIFGLVDDAGEDVETALGDLFEPTDLIAEIRQFVRPSAVNWGAMYTKREHQAEVDRAVEEGYLLGIQHEVERHNSNDTDERRERQAEEFAALTPSHNPTQQISCPCGTCSGYCVCGIPGHHDDPAQSQEEE